VPAQISAQFQFKLNAKFWVNGGLFQLDPATSIKILEDG
jgi:hypothetical protein